MKTKKLNRVRYDWDRWLSKPRFRLVRGKDFACQTYAMAQQIRNVASQRKVEVHLTIEGDTVKVTVPRPMKIKGVK